MTILTGFNKLLEFNITLYQTYMHLLELLKILLNQPSRSFIAQIDFQILFFEVGLPLYCSSKTYKK